MLWGPERFASLMSFLLFELAAMFPDGEVDCRGDCNVHTGVRWPVPCGADMPRRF